MSWKKDDRKSGLGQVSESAGERLTKVKVSKDKMKSDEMKIQKIILPESLEKNGRKCQSLSHCPCENVPVRMSL